MKTHSIVSQFVIAIVLAAPGAAFGAIIESGDLNIINDPGNPSNGLRFLDMTYSDDLTLSAALSNAQASYSNARLATPSEWDDLFAAAGISLLGSWSASDAFDLGNDVIVTGTGDIAALIAALGPTWIDLNGNGQIYAWSDPDGSNWESGQGTRDFIELTPTQVSLQNDWATPGNSGGRGGWFLVSEAPAVNPVPEPSSLIVWCVLAVGLFGYGSRRNRKRSGATS